MSSPTPPLLTIPQPQSLPESPMGSSKPIGYQFKVRVRPPFSEVGAAFFRPLAPDENQNQKTPTFLDEDEGHDILRRPVCSCWGDLTDSKRSMDWMLGRMKPIPDSCQRCNWPQKMSAALKQMFLSDGFITVQCLAIGFMYVCMCTFQYTCIHGMYTCNKTNHKKS